MENKLGKIIVIYLLGYKSGFKLKYKIYSTLALCEPQTKCVCVNKGEAGWSTCMAGCIACAQEGIPYKGKEDERKARLKSK